MSIAKRAGFTAAALIALIVAGGVGYVVASVFADGDQTVASSTDEGAEAPASPAITDSDSVADSDSADSDSADSDSTDSDSTDSDGADSDSADSDSADSSADADSADSSPDSGAGDDDADADGGGSADGTYDDGRPEGYEGDAPFAIFNGGILYIYGKVADEATYELYEQRFGAIVGPDNVENQLSVDADFTVDEGQQTPVYVTDAVLFEFNSIEIDPQYLFLLDYGATMLRQNPQATLTVKTHTDAVGSEEVNLRVAQMRADAILAYWAKTGVNRDQVMADPRGEEGTSEDDDEATAARQRRAEFIITGLLD